MSLYDFIKHIFGFPRPLAPADPSIPDPRKRNEFKKPVWIDEYVEEDDDILSQQHAAPMFPVLSDPLEIHRYFEQQMEFMQQIMRSFSGFPQSSILGGKQPEIFGAIESPDTGSHNLRDQYLKQPDGVSPMLRKDTDLDQKVGIEGLRGIMGELDHDDQRTAPSVPMPRFRFFGESLITKTVQKPDGTVETRTTKRRSDGTEETVVSVHKADGSVDVQTQTGLMPRSGMDIFSERTDDQFFINLFDNFFRRN